MNKSRWTVGALLAALVVVLAGLFFISSGGSSHPTDARKTGRPDRPESSSGPRPREEAARHDTPADVSRDGRTNGPGARDVPGEMGIEGDPPGRLPEGAGSSIRDLAAGGDPAVAGAILEPWLELRASPEIVDGREVAIALAPDGKVLAIGRRFLSVEPESGADAPLRLVSTESGEVLASTTGRGTFLLGLEFDAEGKALRLLSSGDLFEYEVPELGPPERVLNPMEFPNSGGGKFDRCVGYAGGFTLLQISTGGRAEDEGTVAVILPRRRDPRQDWRILVLMRRDYPTGPALLASSADGSRLALLETPQKSRPEPCPLEDRLRVFRMPSGELAWEKQMPAAIARDRYYEPDGLLAISPDGSTVALGRDDGSVLLLDLRTGVETGRMEPPATLRERVDVVTWSHGNGKLKRDPAAG